MGRGVVAIVVALVVTACTSAVEGPNDSSLTSDRRDREVWLAAIGTTTPSRWLGFPWAFAVQTSSRFRGSGARLVRDSTERRAAPFIEDFIRRNHEVIRLPIVDVTHPSEEIAWIGPGELPDENHPDSADWQALAARTPGVQRVSVFTRPAYDSSRTRAYLIRYEVCAPAIPGCHRNPLSQEFRLVGGRWMYWRIQRIPPDPALDSVKLELRAEPGPQ